jgi:outer membrane protein assembly factor BamD (BamD/ComL family)
MQIELDYLERNLMLSALKIIKPIIQEPQTKRAVRETYKRLKEKLKKDSVLSQEIRDTVGDGKVILTGVEPTRPSK